MEKYIVKIKSYYKNQVAQYGTGIVISENLILTASHILCGDRYTVEIDGKEVEAELHITEGSGATLQSQTHFSEYCSIFSNEEILDEDSKWAVRGYIGELQAEHEVSGIGFGKSCKAEIWDKTLLHIESGEAGDYRGMSGSPVFCDERIVGILQMQGSNRKGELGIRMSSIETLLRLLPDKSIKKNEYLLKIQESLNQYTRQQIEKNLQSKKYIPDIFVEERDYKEKIRFFADPCLFLSKVIAEVVQLDFQKINLLLIKSGMNRIDFTKFKSQGVWDELETIAEEMEETLKKAVKKIKKLEKEGYQKDIPLDEFYNTSKNLLNQSIAFELDKYADCVGFINKKYVLLTKNAGQGKTNFVCDFTNNFLLKKGFLVLYYNAYDFHDDPMHYIERQLCIDGRFSLRYVHKVLMQRWVQTKRPLMIVIDGLNENIAINNFGQVMRDFLEKCETYPYIKVLMTTRNEFLQERFSMIETGRYQKRFKQIDMWGRDNDFKERIFRGYLSYFNITIREDTLSERAYDLLTKDVLLLRFFCEVHEHQQQIYLYDVYKYRVFQKYVEKKEKEYRGNEIRLNQGNDLHSLLNKIVQYMLENNNYFHVPTRIFDKDEEKLLIKMLNNEVIFKDELVEKVGFLEKKSMSISFTFDEFRDFCITNYLLENYGEEKSFLQFWNEMNRGNSTICEGVQKYVFYLSKSDYQDALEPVIKKLPEYEELYWNYIWGVEDCYLSQYDVELWKKQVLQKGKYRKRVIHELFMRYDCDFYRTMNICVLLGLMDGLSKDIGEYRAFIREMFGVRKEDKYWLYHQEHQVVYHYNDLVEELESVCGKESNKPYREHFKLTVYLYGLYRSGTMELWKRFYKADPDNAREILKEMNLHKSKIIQSNVKDILVELINSQKKNKDDKLQILYDENSYHHCNENYFMKVFSFDLGNQVD